MRLLVATSNPGKVRELARLFAELSGVELVGLDAVEGAPEVVEDADTFAGNAVKKARTLAAFSGLPTLADDSGLEVDALSGAPGIYSARYAGDAQDDRANNDKLLRALDGVDDADRTARFRCALALVDLHGALSPEQVERVHVEEGVLEGRILRAPRGEGGFGYDPLFVPLVSPRGLEETTAEIPPDVKNRISHRADASRKMLSFLRETMRGR